jgi:hypothetical protein
LDSKIVVVKRLSGLDIDMNGDAMAKKMYSSIIDLIIPNPPPNSLLAVFRTGALNMVFNILAAIINTR